MIESLESRRLLHAGDDLAADNFGINVGGADYADSTGLRWEDSRGFNSSSTAQTVTSNNAIAGTSLDPLFKTARQDFNMKFAGSVPDGTYNVSLYFAEQRYTGDGQRVFSINVEGKRVETNFDIYKTAGAKNTAVVKTYKATITDGVLNVDFVTGETRAVLNAIRVQPADSTTPTDPGTGSGTFKPGTISWSTKASASVKREEAVSFVSGGKLYTIGGYINGKFAATTRIDVYDPNTNKWSQKGNAPTKITHTGLAIDSATGSVWMVGGFIGDFPGPDGTTAVWKYTPSSGKWVKGPSLPVSRGSGGAGIIGNKLYYVSGSTGDRKSDSGTCYVLDLANQSAGWKTFASIPSARNHFGYTVVGGKLYVIGGQTGLEGKSVSKSSVYVYDPSTNKWSSTTALPKAYSHFTFSMGVYKSRYIMLAGGENPHNHALSDVMMFDTVTKKWAKLKSLPDVRRAGGGGIIGSKFIFSGGYKYGSNQLSTTWTADLTKLGL